jgi:asparaginyl-tRNA synthetase
MTDLITAPLTAALKAPHSWRSQDTHYEVALTSPWYKALFELTDIFHNATVDFWRQMGVKAAYLPLTTGSISSPMGRGSDSTPVKVEVEGVPTYLADSMQFLLEYTCRLSPNGTYYVMPSFRGERADATHLCQFYHSEAEIPGDLGGVMDMVQKYIVHLSKAFLRDASDLVEQIAGSTDHLLRPLRDGFRRVTFDEAVELLDNAPGYIEEAFPGCRSMTRAGERRLMELLGEFTWVTHMDHLSVPFYQAFDEADPTKAKNGDLLFGIGETVGCGERNTSAAEVRAALKVHEVGEDAYAWYVRMRELTPMHTSGFGMGVERFLLWVLQHDDIRDLPTVLRFNGCQINP